MMKNKEKVTISPINHQSNPGVDIEKVFRRRGKYSSEYTCTHCFKAFTSALSYGGHQNAHRAERKEEKRLRVKHLNAYRKKLYLQSLRPQGASSDPVLPPTQSQLHGNQTESKPLLSIDLNLPAAGSDDELDEGEFSLVINYENNDGNNIVGCQPLDLAESKL